MTAKIPEIIPIWQSVGNSTHIIAKKLSEKYGIKTSHTGTLDPIAEGVIIVLTGETRHKKYEYANWIKEYEFELLLGIETDSGDGLGLITNESPIKLPSKTDLVAVLNSFVGEYSQTVPQYSAIKVKGKPLHWYARADKLPPFIPKREGTVNSIGLHSVDEISLQKIVTSITQKIEKVQGDLRQHLVTENWKKFLDSNQNDPKLVVLKIKVQMTKGLYVRSLGQDIAAKLGTVGFIFSLVRTQNGEYSFSKCKMLEELNLLS